MTSGRDPRGSGPLALSSIGETNLVSMDDFMLRLLSRPVNFTGESVRHAL
jgi:hypothetical protein